MNIQWRQIGPHTLGLACSLLMACNASPGQGTNPPPTTMPPPTTPPPTTMPPPTTPPPTTPPPTTPPPVTPTVPVGTTPVGSAKDCNVDRLSGAHVYGSKVKTLLTGQGLTAADLDRLRADEDSLKEMIGEWLETPEAQGALHQFLEMSFQQDNVTLEGIMMMLRINNANFGRFNNPRQSVTELLIANMQESFARTALKMIEDGTPFNEVNTVQTFEMTTALMVFYSYLDARNGQDDDSFYNMPMNEVADFTLLRNAADEPPADQVLNPNSPNFLKIYHPRFDQLCLPATQDEYPFTQTEMSGDKRRWLFLAMLGRVENIRNRPAGNQCRTQARTRTPLLAESDFTDWRPVTIRRANMGETPVRFYRASVLRNRNELLSRYDRVGFFTTLGFFGTWPTNEDNSMRVTLNQTLITALGTSFDGQAVVDFSPPNLDEEHADPATACYGCHQTLDPMRDYFRQSYTSYYGEQRDQDRIDLQAEFRFRGIEATGQGVLTVGQVLRDHPDFAPGWTQKLCFFANAAECDEESIEFRNVVEAFKNSNFDFKVLLTELFSSPLVTNAQCLEEGDGPNPSISRRDQFCNILSNRLGVPDICAQYTPTSQRSALQRNVFTAVASVPQDQVSRGEPHPITISETGLFTRATREVVCQELATRGYVPVFGNAPRAEVLERLVTELMGLSASDPRHDEALAILTEHVVEGRAEGANERQSLQSAMIVACMSPGVAGVGF